MKKNNYNNKNIFYVTALILMLGVAFESSPALSAPGCAPALSGVNVRESYQARGVNQYTASRDFIHECRREGYDPPHGAEFSWLPRRGRGHGALSGSNIQFPAGRSDSQCPPPVLRDNEVCEHQQWPNCNGTPGGLSQEGGPGTDTCAVTANADGTATLAAEGEPELPEIEAPEEDFTCGLSLSGSFSGGIGEGQACASGGADFCGIVSIEGNGCVGADGVTLGAAYVGPGGRYEGEIGYDEIQGVPLDSALEFAQHLNRNPNSNFILPEGGNIDLGGELQVEVERPDGTTETITVSSIDLPSDAFIAARTRGGVGNNGTTIITSEGTYTIPSTVQDAREMSITSSNGDFVFTQGDAQALDNPIPQFAQDILDNTAEAQENIANAAEGEGESEE